MGDSIQGLDQGLVIWRGSRIGDYNIPRRKAAEEKRKSCFQVWELTPSYERRHHGYMVHITICYWNIEGSGHLRICKQDVKTKNFSTSAKSDLTTWSHQKMQIWYPCGKNIKVMEDFLSFLTVIFTPWYDQRFRRYDFLELTGLLKFCSGQNQVSHKIWTFDSKSNAISGNFQYQPRR
jgi:hypothetical protein